MWLTRLSVNNPYFAAVLVLAAVVLGLFSLNKLPIEAFPDVRFPVAVIQTTYKGASPEMVESDVSKPLEENLNTINGIKKIRSYSFEGSSTIVVEFELSVDISLAIQDVRDKVSMISGGFRREIDTPIVSQVNPSDEPMMSVAISSTEMSPRDLTNWVENTLKKRLQTVIGVGDVEIVGGTSREINIALHPEKLKSLNLSVTEVAEALAIANQDRPAGNVHNAVEERSIRLSGKIKDPLAFADVVIQNRNGHLIRVRDVATVIDGEAEKNSIALLNGKPSLSLDIRANRGANVVQVADGIKKALAQMQAEEAERFSVNYTYDQSADIKTSVADVRSTLLEGIILTILIVYLFLGSWRSTVITGLTLPISLIGTLFVISLLGFTINLMTLMAMSLSIGLLIDDAIVVRENIVRHAGFGKNHYQAALDGTKEIGLAVLATTLCIVAVFVPIGYMDGIIGQFFHQFALTVAIAIMISMVVSLTLDPMLSSIWYDPGRSGKRSIFGKLSDRFDVWLGKQADRYARAVLWTLSHRLWVLIITIGLTIGSFALVSSGQVGAEFMPDEDRGEFSINFKTAPGSSLDYTLAKSMEVKQALADIPEIDTISANIGAAGFGNGKINSSFNVNIGKKDERSRTLNEVMAESRRLIEPIAGIEITSIAGESSHGSGKPISIGIRGSNLGELETAADAIMAELSKIEGVADIESTLTDADPSFDVTMDRNAAANLGVSLENLGTLLETMFAGKTATLWEAEDGNSHDVRLRIPQTARTEDLLHSLTVPAAGQDGQVHMITLSNFTQIASGQTPREIHRVNLQREITLTSNIRDRDASAVFADVDALKDRVTLPPDVQFIQEGESQDMVESGIYALQALALGIIFIYMILAAQFRSFTLPISIMVSLPLVFIGVFGALWLTNNTLNMFSIIGIVMLMGLAAKNGILLVDFINHARLNEGLNRTEAIVEAGRVRLRPILMTSLAMIFGMLPLALGGGESSETREPMAWAVIGGLITSTVLTLFVVPVVYTLLDSLRTHIHRLIKRLNRTPDEASHH